MRQSACDRSHENSETVGGRELGQEDFGRGECHFLGKECEKAGKKKAVTPEKWSESKEERAEYNER